MEITDRSARVVWRWAARARAARYVWWWDGREGMWLFARTGEARRRAPGPLGLGGFERLGFCGGGAAGRHVWRDSVPFVMTRPPSPRAPASVLYYRTPVQLGWPRCFLRASTPSVACTAGSVHASITTSPVVTWSSARPMDLDVFPRVALHVNPAINRSVQGALQLVTHAAALGALGSFSCTESPPEHAD